jgi:hypothetical protein
VSCLKPVLSRWWRNQVEHFKEDFLLFQVHCYRCYRNFLVRINTNVKNFRSKKFSSPDYRAQDEQIKSQCSGFSITSMTNWALQCATALRLGQVANFAYFATHIGTVQNKSRRKAISK